MRISPLNQQMNINRMNQNASANRGNDVNFGTKLKGFNSLKELIPTDHPLIARLGELSKDGKARVLKFNWGEAYRGGSKMTSYDIDSGAYYTWVETGCLDPHLNLTPSLDKMPIGKAKKYLKILQQWHKGPEVGEVKNLSHKVTYTDNNPSQGHFKQPKFNYSYADSDQYGRVNTKDYINGEKKDFAPKVANWLVELLKASDKQLDNPVLKSLSEAYSA